MTVCGSLRSGKLSGLGRAFGAGIIAAVVAGRVAPAQSPPVVSTDKGAVRGVLNGGVISFLGVPYAAPPTGELRWQPPQPPEAWTGTRDATVVAPRCPQRNRTDTSEDCLYLNVYAPADPIDRTTRPVMFWIHGGGLTEGGTGSFDPTWLVEQDVVVVTIAYRLGLLGFLAHPGLTAESSTGISGNYGLLDSLFALRWVQSNIAAFGGNPENVTLFGQSSGGLIVRALLASPHAKDLFHKAIVQSGSRQEAHAMNTAHTMSEPLVAKIGCPDQTLACMRGLPPAAWVNVDPFPYPSLPVIDGALLTQSIRSSIASGAFNRVPVLEGTTRDEGSLNVAQREWNGATPLTAADYSRSIATLQRGGYSSALVAAIMAEYPLSAYSSTSLAVTAVETDGQYACRARNSAQALSKYVPTFQYEFDDRGAPLPFWFARTSFEPGSFHAAELTYLLPLPRSPALTQDQSALSAVMVRAWTTFAETGSPAPGWQAYSAASDQVTRLSLWPPREQPHTTFARDHRCAFWERLPDWPN